MQTPIHGEIKETEQQWVNKGGAYLGLYIWYVKGKSQMWSRFL